MSAAAHLARLRARHRSWAIIRMDDGSYRAMREWHGSQQIIRVPTAAELDAQLVALPAGCPIPSPTAHHE